MLSYIAPPCDRVRLLAPQALQVGILHIPSKLPAIPLEPCFLLPVPPPCFAFLSTLRPSFCRMLPLPVSET